MNREQLIVELTGINPNESRKDVEEELMPLIDQYAERVALEARIDELQKYLDHYNDDYDRYADSRIAELKAQQEEV